MGQFPLRLTVCMIVACGAAASVRADGPGGGDSPYVWVRASAPGGPTPEVVHFTTAYAQSTADVGFDQVSNSMARAQRFNNHQGELNVACELYTHDPYLGNYMTCGADAEIYTPIRIDSGTLTPGTEVQVNFKVSYTGTLLANEMTPGLTSRAYVEALFEIIHVATDDSLVSVEGGLQLSHTYDQNRVVSHYGDPWPGTYEWNPVESLGISAEYKDTLTFTAVVGEEYMLYFDIATGCYSSAGATELKYDTWTRAAFFDTATYEFSSDDDVQFTVLPEPASFSIIALGALALIRRARGRDRRQ